MKVLKFGGTSVADSKSINNVISILKDNDEPLFIIVSALGGITNLLQKCIVSKGQSVDGIINEIEKPLIGPKPKANKKTAANNVVKLESRIVT